MRAAHVIEITTPKKVLLNGLWFGPANARRVIVWVHGLGSSAFSKQTIFDQIIDKSTAVLAFNNRGHDRVSRITLKRRRTTEAFIAGGGAEIFTECADDIQGAISFAKKSGAGEIYLAGHSTGCQKSVYWAQNKRGGVAGIILLAPMSDYAAAKNYYPPAVLSSATKTARDYMRSKKQNEILPTYIWPGIDTAQRFLSLYTPDSVEEIFSYAQPKKNPKILKSVKIPTLVLLAGADEYGDRPAREIGEWFSTHIRAKHSVVIVSKVGHSFKGGEKAVARAIQSFMKDSHA